MRIFIKLLNIDKFGILIFSVFYRVMCVKNNIDFVLRLFVVKVKLIFGNLIRL